jgi:hypothetical protein
MFTNYITFPVTNFSPFYLPYYPEMFYRPFVAPELNFTQTEAEIPSNNDASDNSSKEKLTLNR